MVPVLGYARSDRVDRSHRDGSPNSYGSSDSSSSHPRLRLADRFRRGSEPNTESKPPRPTHGDDSDAPRIEDYCLGTPKKVAQNHNGAVTLYVSLQEKAVFLPTIKRRHRHHRHRHAGDNSYRENQHGSAGGGASGGSAGGEDYDQPPPDDPERENDDEDDEFPHAEQVTSNDSTDQRDTHLHSVFSNGRGAATTTTTTTTTTATTSATQSEGILGSSFTRHLMTDQHSDNSSDNANQEHGDHDHAGNEHAGNDGSYRTPPLRRPSEPTQEQQGSGPGPGSASGSELHTGGTPEDESKQTGPCSTLRGSVLLKLTKPTKIKEIGINFYCISRTLWNLLPQPALFVDSALPNNAQVEDLAYLGIHRWDFVPLEQYGAAHNTYDKLNAGQSSTLIGQDLYGADTAIFKDSPREVQQRKFCRVYNSKVCRMRGEEEHQVPVFGPLSSQPRKMKQSNVPVEGVLFPAGSYVYNFTLLVDAKTPASVSAPNGQVRFVLGAKVVRTGAFTMNLNGHIDVDVVRAPQEISELTGAGIQNDAVLLSRIWEDRFVYSLNLEHRNITLDVPTKLTLTLMPLSNSDVKIHQMQVFATETITYIYSLDQTIRYVDPSMKLLIFQKDTRLCRPNDSLLSSEDSTTISTNFVLASGHNSSPREYCIEPYHRGRYGELRFLEPDVKGPYIRVRHRLQVVLNVSRPTEGSSNGRRSHFEVKIDTPITILSRHCVSANISLPSYQAHGSTNSSSDNDEYNESEQPPSFDDAMAHQLLGPPGAPGANPRGTKASFTPSIKDQS